MIKELRKCFLSLRGNKYFILIHSESEDHVTLQKSQKKNTANKINYLRDNLNI